MTSSPDFAKLTSDIEILKIQLKNLEAGFAKFNLTLESMTDRVASFNGSIEDIKKSHRQILAKHNRLSARIPHIDCQLNLILDLTKRNAENMHPELKTETMRDSIS